MKIKRDFYLKKLIDRQNNGLIKIITGIRRCGKSYLLNNIFANYLKNNGVKDSHIIKIDFDSPINKKYCEPIALYKYLKSLIKDKKIYYFLLDEIQKVKEFESVLNGMLRIQNVDIYVTGSNSKFLSSDIITEFRGRGDEIRLYPLSFSEYYSINSDTNINSIWRDYYTYGGLPLVALQKDEEIKMELLKSQFMNVYINDIIERNAIENKDNLETVVKIISSNIGSLTNPTRLANIFNSKLKIKIKITNKTINSYLYCMEDAFLIEKSHRYDIKGNKYIDTPLKYYFTDMGIRNSWLNFRQQEESHIMENIIYIELKRRNFSVDIGIVEIRDEKGSRKKLEIDFIANKGNNKIYIQSALELTAEKKNKQEIRPLLHTNNFFKKFVIVRTGIKTKRDENGIIFMDILDFLLNQNSLDY